MPLTRRTLMIAALAVPPARAFAQPATPVDVDSALADHVAWVVSLFAGGAADITAGDVEARFDENFLTLVPPDEFIATIQQLAGELGPIELVEDQSTEPGEFIGLYRSESGDGVMISIAADPATGLISGFFITPMPLPTAASPAASPAATPVASAAVQLDAGEQAALYTDILAAIRQVGEPAVDAVLAGDDDALEPLLSDDVAAALGSTPISAVIASYTSRQVAMTFAEADAHFFGQWSDDRIAGVMMQNGAPFPFQLTAGAPQQGDLPEGQWAGELATLGLDIAVTFGANPQGNLTAALTIPQQRIEDVELTDVRYRADQPVGDQAEERVFAPGGLNDGYTADFAWGEVLLRVIVGVDVDAGKASALRVLPAVPVPPDDGVPETLVAERLPFDGTWWVFWGGESELQNYHVAAPAQRYASDIVIWKDGATYQNDGATNADHWAWGQPVLAPVGGEVVRALNDEEDLPPGTNAQDRLGARDPGGNHVVIRVTDAEYVIIAHMQQGSVVVRQGDKVNAGDMLGLCGNSGNTSEPHIHIHAQATPMIEDSQAQGIPLRFADILVDGEPEKDALPVQGNFVANP